MTPARELVLRFGDPDRMAELYHGDIEWRLPVSSGRFAGPHRGRDAVLQFNRMVWGELYFPEVEVDVLEETGDAQHSSVRFRYRARIRPGGGLYEVEYAVFARCDVGQIIEVHEMLDTLGSQRQLKAARAERSAEGATSSSS